MQIWFIQRVSVWINESFGYETEVCSSIFQQVSVWISGSLLRLVPPFAWWVRVGVSESFGHNWDSLPCHSLDLYLNQWIFWYLICSFVSVSQCMNLWIVWSWLRFTPLTCNKWVFDFCRDSLTCHSVSHLLQRITFLSFNSSVFDSVNLLVITEILSSVVYRTSPGLIHWSKPEMSSL